MEGARPGPVRALVLLSGVAGLTWELVWQHHAALATGVSAVGAAITLACTMGGMAAGSLVAGRLLRRRRPARPVRLYGLLEAAIGVSGLLLGPGFAALERLDGAVWRLAPGAAPLVQAAGIALLLGPPALAMGATLPVFRLMSDRHGVSLASLYGLNTAGAALGVLGAAFVVVPALGMELTAALATMINLSVCLAAWLGAGEKAGTAPAPAGSDHRPAADPLPPGVAAVAVAVTGFATFALEVAWFRSLRAAFQSTTDSFALILAAVLVPLALGARVAAALRARRGALAGSLGLAAALVLLATPVIERFDLLAPGRGGYWPVVLGRLGLSVAVMGPPMLALGVALPWVLDRQAHPRAVGRLYALNTAGAVAGALSAAWLLLPTLGFARTAWGAGLLIAAAATWIARRQGAPGRLRPWAPASFGAVGLVVAVAAESGVGRLRVQGAHLTGEHRVLASHEGPDATVSVVAYPDGVRELVIDGFHTSGESRNGHYMAWMGHLPMILHPDPGRALVICFGTGQTANAVRREGPRHLDIVELSPAVLAMAPLFPSNEGVLDDPRVHTHVMDGRAWLRRTDARYDVVTLEPMEPHFAGTNALYSRRFYELVAARLNPGGIVAQWLPLHLLTPEEAAAVTATFHAVFPDALLWIDPIDRTGILVGRHGRPRGTPWTWPGLDRTGVRRDLDPAQIRAAVNLDPPALARYAALGPLITDDNQYLAYGPGRRRIWAFGSNAAVHRANLDLARRVAAGGP